jgi:ankyrin repeat protein
MLAAAGAKLEVIPMLLAQGADVNAKDNRGQTALMKAAQGRWKHLEVVKLLVERGADINATDNEGNTAVTLAGSSGQPETVRFLSAKGARIGSGDAVSLLATARTNALLSAVAGRQVAEVKMLLDQGADANGRMKDGTPVLLTAAEGYQADEIVPTDAHVDGRGERSQTQQDPRGLSREQLGDRRP